MNRIIVICCAGVCLWVACTAHADVIDLFPDQDATIYEESSTLANGAGQLLIAGSTGVNNSGNDRRGILRFDIASVIPSGATITSAVLRLNVAMNPAGGPASAAFTLHLSLSPWSTGTSDPLGNEGPGALATANDATWAHNYYSTSSWNSVGGDYASLASVTQFVGASGVHTFESQQMISDVQLWVDAPGTNFGWFLLGDETQLQTARGFFSMNDPDTSPVLQIGYTIPEPRVALLYMLGMAWLYCRRRTNSVG